MKHFAQWKTLIIITLLVFIKTSYAIDTAQSKTVELSKINQLIQHLRDALTHDQSKKNQIDQQISKTEKDMQQLSSQLGGLQQNLSRQARTLAALQQKQEDAERAIKQQQDAIATQLQHAYLLSRQHDTQPLFSQSPEDIHRMMRYYRMISEVQLTAMQQLNTALQQLFHQQQQLTREKRILQQRLMQHQKQHKVLQQVELNKKQLLTQLNSAIHTRHQHLAQLLANKQALERLIKRLQAQAKVVFPQGSIALVKLQGKLPWPTQGRIVKRFGSQIDTSGLKYNGVLLSAPTGQAVHAIYPGKVVFAHWLQGFGQLIILEHGKSFMTLYGRNKNLYKKVGDIVKAGEVIAGVGNNSGQEQTGLYFEIRHNGRPSNPENWCH